MFDKNPQNMIEGRHQQQRGKSVRKYSYWMALSETTGIGIASLKKIYESLSTTGLSIQDICELTEEEITAEFSFSRDLTKAIAASQTVFEETDEVYHDILEAGIEPILFFEERYPESIKKHLPSSYPPILYCIGNTRLLMEKSAAILASSEISTKAETICYQSSKLCSSHLVNTAGSLNKHSGTLIASGAMENRGSFLGLIPCGMLTFSASDRLAAMFNPDLHCIVSPFFPKAPVSKTNAEQRNRIICALSGALYIIEMNENDEVLENTAHFAAKQEMPLYTTEYSEFPGQALGNRGLLQTYRAHPVRGRKNGNTVVPNLDAFMAHMKFNI